MIAKISHPRLPAVFNRTRLFDRLDQCRESPVIWISGGPGAGKTTLAASYLRSRDISYIWYQMDQSDDDPANFFHYMSLAASKAQPGHIEVLPKLSPENFLNLPGYAVHFFRALFGQLKKPYIVVLDNYHEVPVDSVIHELVKAGLEQVPSGLNILILSRTPPPPVLTRLLINHTMVTIQSRELSLTEEESYGIAALADKWKTCLEQVVPIYKLTGGWTAGLVLMLEYADPGQEGHFLSREIAQELFFNYFAGEVFNNMEPAVQDFLLKIACMPSFTPEVAEKITGFSKAGKILADMNRKNYFTEKKLDDTAIYQFHPLFREFLITKTEESFEPKFLAELNRYAADILNESGQVEDAFHLYARARDHAAQVKLIRDRAASLMAQGRMGIVENWLGMLPEEVFQADPWLLTIHGRCRLPFDPLESRNAFIQAYRLLQNEQDDPTLILAVCGAVESIVTEWGNFKQLDPWIDELLAVLKDNKNRLPVEIEARAIFALFCALMFRKPSHPEMESLEKRMAALLRSDADTQLRLLTGTYLSHYYCWIGDIFQAQTVIEIMRELIKAATLAPLALMTIKTQEAVYGWFVADFDGCLEAVREGLAEAERSGVRIVENWLLAQEVYARLTLDDPAKARPVLERMKPILNSRRYLDIGHYHHLCSLCYLQAGDHDLALRNCLEALQYAVDTGTPFPEALNCITAAQIYFEKGDEKQAWNFNTRARDIACRMKSNYMEMLCLFNQAYFDLQSGKHGRARESLQVALKIRKGMGLTNFSCWRQEFMQDLYEEALRSGIEVEYVQELIRKRNIPSRQSSVEIAAWPWDVKIFTMGRFEVVKDEKLLLFTGKPQLKPLAMLKSLIALGGKEVGLGQLEDLLWPDAEGDKARQALITTLHRLRKLLGNEKAIRMSKLRMSLNERYCWLDVWAIEKLCRRIDEADHENPDTDQIFSMADDLLQLYRGDFLKHEDGASWARPPRIKLRSRFSRALSRLAQGFEKQGQNEKAAELYLRGLEVDEVAEELYQGVMECYRRMERTAEGLSIYERCRDVLSSVLEASPSPKTEAIRKTLLA